MQSRECYVKSLIRRRYAKRATSGDEPADGRRRAVRAGYASAKLDRLPRAVVAAWSGCGDLGADRAAAGARIVVDLGAGSGVDALIAASGDAPPALVIALDLTPEMTRLVGDAHGNVLPVAGDFEGLPLADSVCDVVIANAAFNLALDRETAFCEAYRILRPGGRLHIRDLVLGDELPAGLLEDPMGWSASLGGVPTEEELEAAVRGAGFVDIAVSGRRAFPPVISVMIDATKPRQVAEAPLRQFT
jgi:SAM-dependent methyltransferase